MGLFDQSYNKPSAQANAVRAYLDSYDGVDGSWNDKWKCYANVDIAEWHNGRERGYVLSFRDAKGEQLNIAFFEHRNSDNICALKWVQSTLNPPTIDTAQFNGIYTDKWDVSHQVSMGKAMEMADWIMEQLRVHWNADND